MRQCVRPTNSSCSCSCCTGQRASLHFRPRLLAPAASAGEPPITAHPSRICRCTNPYHSPPQAPAFGPDPPRAPPALTRPVRHQHALPPASLASTTSASFWSPAAAAALDAGPVAFPSLAARRATSPAQADADRQVGNPLPSVVGPPSPISSLFLPRSLVPRAGRVRPPSRAAMATASSSSSSSCICQHHSHSPRPRRIAPQPGVARRHDHDILLLTHLPSPQPLLLPSTGRCGHARAEERRRAAP